jgi:hypothetical protein
MEKDIKLYRMNSKVNTQNKVNKTQPKKTVNIKIDRDCRDDSYMSYNWLFECGCDSHYY